MSKDDIGFDVQKEMKHLKMIVEKDDRLTITSRFVKYLIEQAEQVGELKSFLEEYKTNYFSELIENEMLEKQNRKYRKALEFYADKRTYDLGVHISMGSAFPRHEPIKYDKGEKAREALEGEK